MSYLKFKGLTKEKELKKRNCQNCEIPFMSSSLVWGLTVFHMKCSRERSLIRYRAGDLAGVIHQFMLFSS